MELSLEADDEDYIIHIDGDVDLYSAPVLKEVFRSLESREYRHYIVNCTEVGYLDSSALGALVFGAGVIRKLGKKLQLVNVRQDLQELLATVNLASLFSIV